MTRPDPALCGAKHGFGRCGLPADGHTRHRAATAFGEVEWTEPEPQTRPDPARYPAGTHVLVEAFERDGSLLLVLTDGLYALNADIRADSVIVHGTVAELEQLQAAVEAHDRQYRVERIGQLRTERDNLTANAARLRQERDDARSWARHGYEIGQRSCTWSDHGVAPAWLTEGHDPAVFTSPSPWAAMDWALTNLRAEVTRIADEMAQTALYGGPSNFLTFTIDRYTVQLRAALATQAPQPATPSEESGRVPAGPGREQTPDQDRREHTQP